LLFAVVVVVVDVRGESTKYIQVFRFSSWTKCGLKIERTFKSVSLTRGRLFWY